MSSKKAPAPTSRRNPVRNRRPTSITIPKRVAPHVKLLFTEMHRQRVTYDEVEEGSGVRRAAMKAWRHKNKPSLDSIEAVFGFLGWSFLPVARAEVLPKALAVDLQAVADKHGTSMEKTFAVLSELLSGITTRFPARRVPRDPEAPPPAPRKPRAPGVHPAQAFLAGLEEPGASLH